MLKCLALSAMVVCMAVANGVPSTKANGFNPAAGHFAKRGGMSSQRSTERGPPKCQHPQGLVPTSRPYTLSANGCGPAGMQVKEAFGLYKCCNRHDVCYGVCGTTHGFCEQMFTGCMKVYP